MIQTYLRDADALIGTLFRDGETFAEPMASELAALREELLAVQDAIVALIWRGVLPDRFSELWRASHA